MSDKPNPTPTRPDGQAPVREDKPNPAAHTPTDDSAPICPSCGSPVGSAEACPSCGFTSDGLDRKYGAAPRYGARVTDSSFRELTVSEIKRLDKILLRFEHRYPQCRFCVFLVTLREGWSLGEYTFHLANCCHFQPPTVRGGENRVILMTVAFEEGLAALSTGYGLEPFLPRSDLRMVIERAGPLLVAKKYIQAVRLAVRTVDSLLVKRLRQ